MFEKCKSFYYALGAAAVTFPSVVFAEDPTGTGPTIDTNIVDTTGIQASIQSSIGTWLVIGLGVALSVTVVYLGYKWIRRFLK